MTESRKAGSAQPGARIIIPCTARQRCGVLFIGARFFEEREAHACAPGGFDWAAFCAVERSTQHPRRPLDYMPLERFRNNRGYHRHPELHATFRWRDLDEAEESCKPMVFWRKALG